VARIELAAGDYALRSMLDNKEAVAIAIFQAPGSNALQLSSAVRATMAELQKNFPDGVEHRVVYDPTINVRDGIRDWRRGEANRLTKQKNATTELVARLLKLDTATDAGSR